MNDRRVDQVNVGLPGAATRHANLPVTLAATRGAVAWADEGSDSTNRSALRDSLTGKNTRHENNDPASAYRHCGVSQRSPTFFEVDVYSEPSFSDAVLGLVSRLKLR